jgi:predicted peptidase
MQKPHSFETTLTHEVRLRYLLYLPKEYRPRGRKRWPLILFLHGSEERGSDLSKVTVHGPPKWLQRRSDFPFIVVSPQCPHGKLWSAEPLMALLDAVAAEHKVALNRIYLTGLSMGGYGVWELGLAYPERFAALAPICGGGDVLSILLATPKKEEALKSLGVWAFHGAKDPLVPVGESERMIQALHQAGCSKATLKVYPEAEHDCWTETYENPKLYDWFLKHRR